MGGKVPDNLEAFGAIDPNAGVVAEIDLSKLERIIKNAPDVGAFTVKLKGEKFYNRCVLTLLDIEVEWGHDCEQTD